MIAVRVPPTMMIMMIVFVGVSRREARSAAEPGNIIRWLVKMPRMMTVLVGMLKLVIVAVAERAMCDDGARASVRGRHNDGQAYTVRARRW